MISTHVGTSAISKSGIKPNNTLLELTSKIITMACGVVTLHVATGKIIKARNGKRKRNASNDVPK
jgi:hypothetical protein